MPKTEEGIAIGDLARRSGASVRTLRLYEKYGLLRPARTTGGRRLYGSGDVRRIEHVVVLKAFGMTLSEIAAAFGNPDFRLEKDLSSRLAYLEGEKVKLSVAISMLKAAGHFAAQGRPWTFDDLYGFVAPTTLMMMRKQCPEAVPLHYTPQAVARLDAMTPDDPAGKAMWRAFWAAIAPVHVRIERMALDEIDPLSPGALDLTRQWVELRERFVGRFYNGGERAVWEAEALKSPAPPAKRPQPMSKRGLAFLQAGLAHLGHPVMT